MPRAGDIVGRAVLGGSGFRRRKLGGKEEGRRTERGSFPSPIFCVSQSFGAFLLLFLGSLNPLSVSNRGYAPGGNHSGWIQGRRKPRNTRFCILPFCNCSPLLLLPLPGSLPWLWVVHNYRVMSGQVLRKHGFKLKDLFFNGVP